MIILHLSDVNRHKNLMIILHLSDVNHHRS